LHNGFTRLKSAAKVLQTAENSRFGGKTVGKSGIRGKVENNVDFCSSTYDKEKKY
jgi:hypothetical protein